MDQFIMYINRHLRAGGRREAGSQGGNLARDAIPSPGCCLLQCFRVDLSQQSLQVSLLCYIIVSIVRFWVAFLQTVWAVSVFGKQMPTPETDISYA